MSESGMDLFKKYSGKAGDVSRQFALAGIALIWLLNGQDLSIVLKGSLSAAFWCISISLTLDIIQYFLGSVLWFINREATNAEECKKTIIFTVILIVSKLVALLWGFLNILYYLKNVGFLV